MDPPFSVFPVLGLGVHTTTPSFGIRFSYSPLGLMVVRQTLLAEQSGDLILRKKKMDVSLGGWLRTHVFQHCSCGLEVYSELDDSQEWISFIIFKSISTSYIPRPQTPSLSNTITLSEELSKRNKISRIYIGFIWKGKGNQKTHFDDQAFKKKCQNYISPTFKSDFINSLKLHTH